uniref:Predicted gene 10401 n=1 Tax=Mus spicilegus TaxID=10103 RepID=A0A8C6GW17_MUSSI
MHWFKRRLLKTAREKPVKRKGSKSSNFSSLICYTDQKEESPQPTSLSVQRIHSLQPHATLKGDSSVCEEAR